MWNTNACQIVFDSYIDKQFTNQLITKNHKICKFFNEWQPKFAKATIFVSLESTTLLMTKSWLRDV